MNNAPRTMRAGLLAISSAAALALSGCGDDTRTAEAETPVSEAQVETELPENVVSDEQLQATADVAAELASSPPPQMVPVPVPAPGTGAGSAGQATGGAGTQNRQVPQTTVTAEPPQNNPGAGNTSQQ